MYKPQFKIQPKSVERDQTNDYVKSRQLKLVNQSNEFAYESPEKSRIDTRTVRERQIHLTEIKQVEHDMAQELSYSNKVILQDNLHSLTWVNLDNRQDISITKTREGVKRVKQEYT